jgi:putative transcriptional regulator
MSGKRQSLQNARKEMGLTRTQLAEKLGVSAEHVKSLEYGRVNPSPQLLFKISAELSKPPEELFPDIVLAAQK